MGLSWSADIFLMNRGPVYLNLQADVFTKTVLNGVAGAAPAAAEHGASFIYRRLIPQALYHF